MSRVILFAGGGSGGHISPGLAIAERLHELEPDVTCVFACSERPIDAIMLEDAGATWRAIPARPPRPHPLALIRFAWSWPRSVAAAGAMLRKHRVDRVVAMGGFVAAPVVRAAGRRGVPTLLLNIDDPPGRANRWMAPRCDAVLTAIDLPGDPGFARETVGMPVRRKAIAVEAPGTCRAALGLDPGLRTLLVTGASQGAATIDALATAFASVESGSLEGWQILHLAPPHREATVRDAYDAAGVRSRVHPFLHEMGLAWGSADLALSRAGANSVAEAAANAVPTLFLPFPWHGDGHQRRHAQRLVGEGGAELVEDRVDVDANLREAGQVLLSLLEEDDRRDAMRRALLRSTDPDAAAHLARLLLDPLPR